MEFKYLEQEDIVMCQVSGKYEFTQKSDLIEQLNTSMKEHNCKKCIIDYRHSDVILNTFVAYNRPETFQEIGFDNKAAGAIVFKNLTKECFFYEDVCQNRGWNMKVFDDYDQALKWLKE